MKPILFPKTATQFNTNGLGRLDFISCQVTEERNGIYELEGTIAESADHAKQIESESIIVAKPSQGAGLQAFRVYKITKPIGGQFMVYARHISYQLGFITSMPFTVAASASACNSALQGFITNAAGYTALDFPFSFWTDVNTASSYNQTEPATIRSRLGGVEGSILDQFGGEYEWDNFQIKLHKKRGLTNPTVTLRYGKNITDLQQEENIENTVTGIVPFWADSEGGELVTLPEKIIEVQNAASYPFKKTIPHDFSQAFETKPTESQLRSRAQAYVNTSGIGVPKVSIKLSFVNLADTEEFKEIAPLQSVNLCDDIKVQFEKLGIDTTAEIVKTEYDVLREKYNSIEIGSLRGTLASTISTNMEDISEVNKVTKEIIKSNNNDIGQKIDDATKWLTSGDGYVVAVQDPQTNEWSELLFMDTADVETAHNVLRVNQNGIGFSRNGVNGPYTQAWTLDGRLIVGGTNVPSFTVYDSQQNVIFETTAAGTVWNSTNSSMTQDGTLTIKNATISGGTLSVLKPNAANPPTDSDYLFRVNTNGMLWNLTNSSMTADGKLTIKEANVSGIIKTQYTDPNDPTTAYIQLRPQWIEFFPPGANSAGVKFDFGGSSGHAYMYLTAESVITIISPSIQLKTEDTSNAEGIYFNSTSHFAHMRFDSYIRLDTGDLDLGCDTLYIYDDEFGYAEGQSETISINSNDLVFIKGILVYYGPHEDNPYIPEEPDIPIEPG